MCNLDSGKDGIEYKIFTRENNYTGKMDYVIPISGANYNRYQRGGY